MDVSAGVAGDMLLGALLDAGAALPVVQAAVDAVLPGTARLSVEPVVRAGLRAVELSVEVSGEQQPHRRWRDLRGSIERADLAAPVRRDVLAVFGALARAEARVHGIAAEDVHFHEVGAVDSVADVVGVCAAVHDLKLAGLVSGPVALGSGHVRTQHGLLAVPVPAVLELAHGWVVAGDGRGELATPTGMALITTLTRQVPAMPAIRIGAVGIGAGTRDPAERANVVRVVLGEPMTDADEVVIEANIDDLDPRVWPSVLAELLRAGAADAWLTPILMKKGRPAHTLHALTPSDHAAEVRETIIKHTSTIGVRQYPVTKYALPRAWVPVEIDGTTVRIKIAFQDGVIRQATPEFRDVEALAHAAGRPVQDVLRQAVAAAQASGLTPGSPHPDSSGKPSPGRATPDSHGAYRHTHEGEHS
ncbi:nickel pincer cofactor biosynthesis protein LarC [Paractinoplanes durhamensis]|uniref:nickel pincer cofactor biosynthesis protein LarC n=1 Tax=Paractinoplanes durhamensis TaxID=113563 RepID=UPI0031E26C5E